MTALALDIREKRFAGGAPILGAIRLTLAAGETAALLGPSGVGKSTLLGVAAGLDRDFTGAAHIGAARMAMVFQEPRLLPWRSLRRNLALVRPDLSDAADRAGALLARVGLAGAEDLYPERASLGMKRRASLARALMLEPDLLIMDEPLASLDEDSAQAMRRILRETLTGGCAALIATHDHGEALSLCGRVIEIGGAPAGILRDRASPLGLAERADGRAVADLRRAWFGDPQNS